MADAATKFAYFVIAALTLAIVTSIVWLIWVLHDLGQTLNYEHPACPSYYCEVTHDDCKQGETASGAKNPAGSAFRYAENGTVQCQKYTLRPTVTDTPISLDPSKWPDKRIT